MRTIGKIPKTETVLPRSKLIEGFNRFRSKYYENGTHLMETLAKEGAHPDFFVINCIDPRNGADLVFDAEPGQQFIHSQMAAIIPPYDPNRQCEVGASLSYAIEAKKIKHLIVMGHSLCGGVTALVDGTSDHYIESWTKMAAEAKKIAKNKVGTQDHEVLQHETERQVVIMSLHNLMSYPMVKKALQEKRLTINGWFFDMQNGTLHEYMPQKHAFKQLTPPAVKQDNKPAAAPSPPKFGS
jgi:carbonic anhydrase